MLSRRLEWPDLLLDQDEVSMTQERQYTWEDAVAAIGQDVGGD